MLNYSYPKYEFSLIIHFQVNFAGERNFRNFAKEYMS